MQLGYPYADFRLAKARGLSGVSCQMLGLFATCIEPEEVLELSDKLVGHGQDTFYRLAVKVIEDWPVGFLLHRFKRDICEAISSRGEITELNLKRDWLQALDRLDLEAAQFLVLLVGANFSSDRPYYEATAGLVLVNAMYAEASIAPSDEALVSQVKILAQKLKELL